MLTPNVSKPPLIAALALTALVLVGAIALAAVAGAAAVLGVPAIFYAVARLVISLRGDPPIEPTTPTLEQGGPTPYPS